MHQKRNKIETFWPVQRKGTKYLAVPTHNKKESLPLVVVMRDVLKLVKNKKELKSILNEKKVLINLKIIHETNYPVTLFDIISIPEMKKHFRAFLSKNKKINFEEISEKESEKKIYKVINKKIINDKTIQLNLMHGRNIRTKEKIKVADSVIINLKDGKIIKIISFEKGRNSFVISGKHAGFLGKIEEIFESGGRKIAIISSKEEKINVMAKNVMVIE